jgi:hypothetical protein
MEHEQPQDDPDIAALQAYLDDEISLGKAADLLAFPGLSCKIISCGSVFLCASGQPP